MINYLVTFAFDGTNYHGWQIQKNAVTVQSVFQQALYKLFSEKPPIKGCSRTDSGVHANMYCVSFKSEHKIKCENIIYALNTFLPEDIAVYDCKIVPGDFHARYSVKAKEYIYKIHNGKIRDPFLRDYTYHYKYPLFCDKMNLAGKAFLGTHDFKGFCSSHGKDIDTVRTIYNLETLRKSENLVEIKICADGFLYNMVRIIVGTLIFVSEGKISPDSISDVILSLDRSRAGKTAPPQGLYLNRVIY